MPAWPVHGPRERELLLAVLESGQWGEITGSRNAEFATAFACFQGAEHAVLTPSGTLALEAALEALGVGPGDEVITSAWTFIATASAILTVGARPVFVDIDPSTNTIDPARTEPQQLVNGAVPSYNFDAITSPEVAYQIDVTRAPGDRIRKLEWRGKPVLPEQEFLVATNNYRASGGGNFPGLDGSRTVIAAPDNNRDILIAYVREARRLTRAANGSARSWTFAPVKTAGPVVFSSAPGMAELAHEAGLHKVRQLAVDDGRGKGLALYAIDLSQ